MAFRSKIRFCFRRSGLFPSAWICLFLRLLPPVFPATAVPAGAVEERAADRSDMNRMAAGVTAVGVAGVTAWGVAQWDYYSRSPHAESEGWFGRRADDGGMDKLGHLYSGYILSHATASLYAYWRFGREDAALYGALTSFAIMGYMESGDSFSDYGFSAEDMAMNAMGSLAGYLLYLRPDLSRKIDLRWQFGLRPTKPDFSTDYDNSKCLLALKLNGFDSLRKGWLRHVELHAGYYVEGFDDAAKENLRHPYLGVGFNFTDLLRRNGYAKTARVFNYFQPPYTSLNHDFDW